MLEIIEVNGRTYKKQMRSCGKACCKGPNGGIHGPYWYLARPGEPIKYVGLTLPPGVRGYLDRLAAAMGDIRRIEDEAGKEKQRLDTLAALEAARLRVCGRLIRGQHVTSEEVERLGLLDLLPMP